MADAQAADEASFNPLPAIKLGDAKSWQRGFCRSTSFNPLPAIKLGDAAEPQGYDNLNIL